MITGHGAGLAVTARPDVGVSGGGEEGGGVVDGAGVAVQPAGEPVGVAVGEFVEQRVSGVDQG